MFYKTAIMNICLITHITSVKALITVYALMCCSIPLCTEFLITKFTRIWTLSPIVKFFLLSALVKTQMLNIRIYSDTKKNSFIAIDTINKNPLHFKNYVTYQNVLQFFL
jgi:hypothetical protein